MTKGNGLPCVRCGTSEWLKAGNCKKCKRESDRQWARANPDKMTEATARWREANPDKVVGYKNKWAQANPDKMAEYKTRYRHANPVKASDSGRRWRQANPDKNAAKSARRRTTKTGAGGSYTAAEFKSMCHHYGNKCLRCGRSDVKLTADHVLPVSKGGNSNIENIQPLCLSCNIIKHDRHIDYRPDAGIVRWIQAKLFG